jgi:hypothetical protein
MKFKCLKQPIKVLLNGELVNHGHQQIALQAKALK